MDEKLYLIDLDCYARAEENQKKKVKESHCFDFGLDVYKRQVYKES